MENIQDIISEWMTSKEIVGINRIDTTEYPLNT